MFAPLALLLMVGLPVGVFSEGIDNDIYQAVSELTQKDGVKTIAVGEIRRENDQVNQRLPDFLKNRIINSAAGRDANYSIVTEFTNSYVNPLIGGGGGNTVQALIGGIVSPLADGGVDVVLLLTSTAGNEALGSSKPFTISAQELERRDMANKKVVPKTFRVEMDPTDFDGADLVSNKVSELLEAQDFSQGDENTGYIVKLTLSTPLETTIKFAIIRPSVKIRMISSVDEKPVYSFNRSDIPRVHLPVNMSPSSLYNNAYKNIADFLEENFQQDFRSKFKN